MQNNELLEASIFVRRMQKEEGVFVGCLEEIAYKNGSITKEELLKLGEKLEKTEYGKHSIKLAKEEN